MISLSIESGVDAQQPPASRYIPEDHRPGLFLRETWKVLPKGVNDIPVTSDYLPNPNLEMKLYGKGKAEVVLAHHDSPLDDPSYIWRARGFGQWRGLDSDNVVEAPDGKMRDHVDLSRVDEIGFTDLSLGSGLSAGGASRVDWIEVYGSPVSRGGATK